MFLNSVFNNQQLTLDLEKSQRSLVCQLVKKHSLFNRKLLTNEDLKIFMTKADFDTLCTTFYSFILNYDTKKLIEEFCFLLQHVSRPLKDNLISFLSYFSHLKLHLSYWCKNDIALLKYIITSNKYVRGKFNYYCIRNKVLAKQLFQNPSLALLLENKEPGSLHEIAFVHKGFPLDAAEKFKLQLTPHKESKKPIQKIKATVPPDKKKSILKTLCKHRHRYQQHLSPRSHSSQSPQQSLNNQPSYPILHPRCRQQHPTSKLKLNKS